MRRVESDKFVERSREFACAARTARLRFPSSQFTKRKMHPFGCIFFCQG